MLSVHLISQHFKMVINQENEHHLSEKQIVKSSESKEAEEVKVKDKNKDKASGKKIINI